MVVSYFELITIIIIININIDMNGWISMIFDRLFWT